MRTAVMFATRAIRHPTSRSEVPRKNIAEVIKRIEELKRLEKEAANRAKDHFSAEDVVVYIAGIVTGGSMVHVMS
jgi:hypothetical protein